MINENSSESIEIREAHLPHSLILIRPVAIGWYSRERRLFLARLFVASDTHQATAASRALITSWTLHG